MVSGFPLHTHTNRTTIKKPLFLWVESTTRINSRYTQYISWLLIKCAGIYISLLLINSLPFCIFVVAAREREKKRTVQNPKLSRQISPENKS